MTLGGLSAGRIGRSDMVIGAGVAAVVAYFALVTYGVKTWPYDGWMVAVLTPILLAIGAVVVVSVTRHDDEPFTRLILTGLVVKLAAAFIRYFVVFAVYGTGDADQYHLAGAEIANAFHRGEVTLVDLLTPRQGTQFIEDLTGIIYTATGPSRLGGFVVFSWLGFFGLLLFQRATRIGLPDGNQHRFALLVFFLPSLVFWPSSIGKESVMMVSLGLCAYGAARFLERQPLSWLPLAAGLGLGYMVRPHLAVVVLGGLVVAVAFRRRAGRAAVFGPAGRILTLLVLVGVMTFVLSRAVDRLLPRSESSGVTAVGELLDRAETGTDSGGSEIDRPTPNTPLEYPEAVFTVLLRPTILEANSPGNAIAAAETTFVLVLGIVSRKRLRNAMVGAFRHPYVMFCLVYTAIFTFAWSAFSNLGALARQRVQVWPFVLVLLCFPLVTETPAARRRKQAPTMLVAPAKAGATATTAATATATATAAAAAAVAPTPASRDRGTARPVRPSLAARGRTTPAGD